jgi:hypothetical protein
MHHPLCPLQIVNDKCLTNDFIRKHSVGIISDYHLSQNNIMRKFLHFLIVISFSSCHITKLEYVGSQNPTTDKVAVFVDEAAILKPYFIVGKGYEKSSWMQKINKEKIVKLAVQKAKSNGADAVFFKETFIQLPSTNIQGYSRSDSLPYPFTKGTETRTSTTISQIPGYWQKEILFLKYK